MLSLTFSYIIKRSAYVYWHANRCCRWRKWRETALLKTLCFVKMHICCLEINKQWLSMDIVYTCSPFLRFSFFLLHSQALPSGLQIGIMNNLTPIGLNHCEENVCCIRWILMLIMLSVFESIYSWWQCNPPEMYYSNMCYCFLLPEISNMLFQ